MNELIEVRNLTKTYGSSDHAVHALRGINTFFQKGSFTAVTGTSGSGKTTLLQLIGGLDRANTGEVLYEGENILALSDLKLSAFRRKNIGFVFQFFNLIPELTARDNIILPLLIDKQKPNEQALTELAERLGIQDRLSHFPSQLSGGQQQRVAIARALIHNPKVLLCDEPTGNLDKKSGIEVLSLFREIQRTYGQTIIMVTHDNEIAKTADNLIRIEDGSLVS